MKVSDFGLSVVTEKFTLDPTQKAPVRWLSPEVFKTHVYTKAADVWAYGVLVWVNLWRSSGALIKLRLQEIFNDAQEPYKGWTGMQIRDAVLESGSKLILPDWAGPYMARVMKDAFDTDPLMRATMPDIVKKIEKFAPKYVFFPSFVLGWNPCFSDENVMIKKKNHKMIQRKKYR